MILLRSLSMLEARIDSQEENEPVDPKAGHIPGAINLPFSQNLSPDGFFESPEQLRQRFENAGCTEGSATVMYCGSGVSACNNLLAFEHAGLGKGTSVRRFLVSVEQQRRSACRNQLTKSCGIRIATTVIGQTYLPHGRPLRFLWPRRIP